MTRSGGPSAGKCPVANCGKGIPRRTLDYDYNTQETVCPGGHRVFRNWRGQPPQFEMVPSTPARTYGWTEWRVV